MRGIDLNKPITYKHSSLRFFEENEHHVTRFCKEDVLVLVYDGVLRFSEDGKEYEIYPGQYHIQKKNMFQEGKIASDSPKYLYIHFIADWTDSNMALPYQGHFDYLALKPIMEELNRLSHHNGTFIEKTAKFFEILSKLYQTKAETTVANKIADFISEKLSDELTLEMLSKKFNFSKNHVINIFKKEYKMTPFEYMNFLRIKKAKSLLEMTSRPVESICYECGFNNYSHFYKLFYRMNHISPTEWRNKTRLLPTGHIS